MPEARRNDPCPCGSGRKYKQCHGAANRTPPSSRDATWRTLRRHLDGFPTTLLGFVREVYGEGAIHEAWAEFTLREDDDPEFDAGSPHLQVFMPWFFHRWAPDPLDTAVADVSLHDRPPTRVFLERRGWRLGLVLRSYLEGCVAAHFSFHEIVRSDPGTGFRTRDVFTGEERDVLERSASRTMRRGDLLFGQVVTSSGVTLLEACPPFAIPPERKIGLVDLRERMARGALPPSPETLGEWNIELRDAYLRIAEDILDPRPPQIRNTEGHDLVFHRMRFEIASPRRAFEALSHLAMDESEDELLEDAGRDAEGELQSVTFPWKVAGNPQHRSWDNTVLGHLEIDGDRLVADVNSRERAARLKRIIEEALGEDARHVETAVETFEDAMTAARARREALGETEAATSDMADRPEVREMMDQLMARHYEKWVSEELPALGGLTPLEAVREAAGREKVEALITQIERDSMRMKPPVEAAVFRELRERLGLV